ncbi:MAG TPA: serine kinase [Candidatus Brocadiia bacterium]|nr:serine kinase [Candidatus Brocadiia bacterium]
MKLIEIAEKLQLKNLTPEIKPDPVTDVQWGYASDLLSDVLAGASAGAVLVTIQVHMNVIAVAANVDLSAVVFASGRRPDETVIKRAVQEGIPLYGTEETTFDVAGKLYKLGLRGHRA